MSKETPFLGKILKADYAPLFKKLRAEGKKIVFTNGCFDLIHKGHIKCLYEASRIGDLLVVGINEDDSVKRAKGPNRPVMPMDSRIAVISAIEFVDYVIPFSEDTPMDVIKKVRPHVLIKGGDYDIEEIVGRELVLKLGGFVKTIDPIPGYSTTEIVNKIIKSTKKQ